MIQGECLLIACCLILGVLSSIYDADKMPAAVEVIIVASIFIYNFSFGYTLGPVVWMYCAEILPEKGISISSMTNWLSCFVITLVSPKIISAIGINILFFIYSGFCFAGLAFFYIFVIETKGLTP